MILMEIMLEVVIGVLVMEVDKVADEVTNIEVVINDTYGCGDREIVVLIMEVNKVADEVTDMEIDK